MLRYLTSGYELKEILLVLLLTIPTVLIALTCHEYAHGYVAYKLGDPTAKNMGRMSLDPTRHLDLMGIVCFVLFGWGWAKPVMTNSRNLKNPRRDDLLISIAGPVANLIVAFVFYAVYFASKVLGNDSVILLNILSTIVSINISFALFNLLPVYPLDGYHVLTSIFPKLGFKFFAFMSRYGMWLLLALSYSGVLDYILTPAAIAIYDLFFNICLIFV